MDEDKLSELVHAYKLVCGWAKSVHQHNNPTQWVRESWEKAFRKQASGRGKHHARQ